MVKISQYNQPSNLSSTLFYKYVIGSVGTSHSFLLHRRGSVYIRDYSTFFVQVGHVVEIIIFSLYRVIVRHIQL